MYLHLRERIALKNISINFLFQTVNFLFLLQVFPEQVICFYIYIIIIVIIIIVNILIRRAFLTVSEVNVSSTLNHVGWVCYPDFMRIKFSLIRQRLHLFVVHKSYGCYQWFLCFIPKKYIFYKLYRNFQQWWLNSSHLEIFI